jgi:hypothetical protein
MAIREYLHKLTESHKAKAERMRRRTAVGTLAEKSADEAFDKFGEDMIEDPELVRIFIKILSGELTDRVKDGRIKARLKR